ncbi:MAG: Cobyrinic acid ac-diamide synthase [Frankiales bacterium]|nr:Cobyrinic acid ac-diamide synthase [Frankiales bacterium]
MATVISIHSFRGGTGKSNTAANLSALAAMQGLRVGVVDTDIQSPGVHVVLGMGDDEVGKSLNDYLWGNCEIEEAAYDVGTRIGPEITGALYLVPSSIKAGDIARIIREGYDVGLLNDGFQRLIEELELDALIIDTHPGMNEETLLSIAISDALAVVMRPDSQDYQGTGVTVEVARRLNVPRLVMVVNKVPSSFDTEQVRQRVSEAYDAEVGAVIPHSDEMMTLASSGVFVHRYPDHLVTTEYKLLLTRLLE